MESFWTALRLYDWPIAIACGLLLLGLGAVKHKLLLGAVGAAVVVVVGGYVTSVVAVIGVIVFGAAILDAAARRPR